MGTAISQCSFGLTPATAVDALAASLIADGYKVNLFDSNLSQEPYHLFIINYGVYPVVVTPRSGVFWAQVGPVSTGA